MNLIPRFLSESGELPFAPFQYRTTFPFSNTCIVGPGGGGIFLIATGTLYETKVDAKMKWLVCLASTIQMIGKVKTLKQWSDEEQDKKEAKESAKEAKKILPRRKCHQNCRRNTVPLPC